MSCSQSFYTILKPKNLTKKYQWVEIEQNNYRLFLQNDSLLLKSKDSILYELDISFNKAKNFVKYNKEHHDLLVFIVPESKEVQKIIHKYYSGISYPIHKVILQNREMSKQSHEFFHFLSIQQWKQSSRWLKEGGAVYVDDNYKGFSLYQIANYLIDNRKWIPIDKLIKDKNFNTISPFITYPESGALVKYIIEKYGMNAFIEIWKSRDIKNTIGIPPKTLEKEFIKHCKATNPKEIDYKLAK